MENLELTSKEIESIEEESTEPVDQKPNIQTNLVQHEKRAEEINQQFIDLELKFSQFEAETDEEELDLWYMFLFLSILHWIQWDDNLHKPLIQ